MVNRGSDGSHVGRLLREDAGRYDLRTGQCKKAEFIFLVEIQIEPPDRPLGGRLKRAENGRAEDFFQ